MAHPYPSRSTGPLLMLSLVTELPVGGYHPAKHRAAEVLRSDSTWAPVTVLAWHQLDEPCIQALTAGEIRWMVQLRLSDGAEGWYEFVGAHLRRR